MKKYNELNRIGTSMRFFEFREMYGLIKNGVI